MKRALVVSAAILFALLLAACSNPTSSDGPGTDQAVVGSVNGVVTDSTTGYGIPGVRVVAQSGNGSREETTTDQAGYYTIPGLIAGDTEVAFYKDGYATTKLSDSAAVIAITGNEAVTQDPWNEIAAVTQAIEAALENNGDIYSTLTTGGFTEGDDGSYTFTASDGSTVNVTISENNEALFNYVANNAGISNQFFLTHAGSVTLVPRSGAVEGRVVAVFQTTEGESGAVEIVEPAVNAPVRVRAAGTDGVLNNVDDVFYPTTEEEPVFTDSEGRFRIERLPIGQDINVEVLPFEQTSSDGEITVFFDGDGSASASEVAANSNALQLQPNTTLMLDETIAVEPNYDSIRVVAHNIGKMNPPLTVGRPADENDTGNYAIDLTFSQGVDPNSFVAFIDRNSDSDFDRGVDVELAATWVADSNNTQVELLPVVATYNQEGYMPYGMKGEETRDILVLDGRAIGNSAPFDSYDIDSVGTGVRFAGVYTEPGLDIERVDFLDASGNVSGTQDLYNPVSDVFYDYDPTSSENNVVPGGAILLDFNKNLTTGTVEVEFFDDSIGAVADDAEDGEEVLPANKVVFEIVSTDTGEVDAEGNAILDTSKLRVNVPSQLTRGDTFMMAVRVKSTDPDGEDVFNTDPDNNIVFNYAALLRAFAPGDDFDLDNVDTNIALETVTEGAAPPAARTTDFGYTDTIAIEFNQALTSNTVAMYHWVDENTDGFVDESELVELTSGTDFTVATAADSINSAADTVLTIDPAGYLAPGETFLLDIDAGSAISEFSLNTNQYYVFTVEANPDEFVAPPSGYAYTISGFAIDHDQARAVDAGLGAGTASAYNNLLDATNDQFDFVFDTLGERFGDTNMYQLAYKPSGADEWEVENTNVANKARLARFLDATENVTHSLGADLWTGSYNYLVADNSVEYLLWAANEKGLLAFSSVVTAEDTVRPAGSVGNSFLAQANASGLTQAGTTYTNNTGAAVELELTFSSSEPISGSSVVVSEGIANANVTVAENTGVSDYTAGTIGVTVTIPDTAVVTTADYVQVVFNDTSGNTVVDDRTVAPADANSYVRSTLP